MKHDVQASYPDWVELPDGNTISISSTVNHRGRSYVIGDEIPAPDGIYRHTYAGGWGKAWTWVHKGRLVYAGRKHPFEDRRHLPWHDRGRFLADDVALCLHRLWTALEELDRRDDDVNWKGFATYARRVVEDGMRRFLYETGQADLIGQATSQQE